jgi:hypothetical protein
MPPSGSISELAIYLDMNFAGTHNDYRLDWDSALSDANGNFLQDYIFNAGTVPVGGDLCGPATLAHFTIAASFNSQRGSAFPQNPAFNPQCIAVSGWYTFRHTFLPDSQGNLEVDMDILNSSGATRGELRKAPALYGHASREQSVHVGRSSPFLCGGLQCLRMALRPGDQWPRDRQHTAASSAAQYQGRLQGRQVEALHQPVIQEPGAMRIFHQSSKSLIDKSRDEASLVTAHTGDFLVRRGRRGLSLSLSDLAIGLRSRRRSRSRLRRRSLDRIAGIADYGEGRQQVP